MYCSLQQRGRETSTATTVVLGRHNQDLHSSDTEGKTVPTQNSAPLSEIDFICSRPRSAPCKQKNGVSRWCATNTESSTVLLAEKLHEAHAHCLSIVKSTSAEYSVPVRGSTGRPFPSLTHVSLLLLGARDPPLPGTLSPPPSLEFQAHPSSQQQQSSNNSSSSNSNL